LLKRYKPLMSAEAFRQADRTHGRLIFSKTCATCHTLFSDGGKIGPDLTGSQRANPEYILTKVLDPSAVVAREYQMTLIPTADGRSMSGIVKEENDKVVSLQTPNEVIRLPKSDIEQRSQAPVSMMPEGLLNDLADKEIRDLLAYLAGANQVPLPDKRPPKN